MQKSGHRLTKRIGGTTRRSFLKISALTAVSLGSGTASKSLARPWQNSGGRGRGNAMPGRIVIFHDPLMDGGLSTINKDRVELIVKMGVRKLMGTTSTAEAFESLFPGLHSASTIAIKVNCIGPTDTRWETVRGVVSGLSEMLDGTYDVSQVVIYDRHNLPAHGYDEDEFTFNGNCPLISSTNNANSGYYVYAGYQLSNYLLDCDYVIDIPVLKSHNDPSNQITLALKNHYGSCLPSSLCGDITGMLTVNTDTHIKDKTCLVLTDALRGTYNGGPGGSPQYWNTFASEQGTPNTLFFSTDPVTNEYWGRDMINAERDTHGWDPKPCPWIEEASEEPWDLGVSDPEAMDVLYLDSTGVSNEPVVMAGATFLAPNIPNPVVNSTRLRFRLARAGSARLVITDASGRLVRRLADRTFPEGYSEVRWDGRNQRGQRLPAGVYFARLETADGPRVREMVLSR
ncbi:MAG: DUF362 domain-containing protein [Candidatus Eisenbacteria sp.]|nr:DUF362 domain-containing protein [Candidatus Eisenbacteria bacterium]